MGVILLVWRRKNSETVVLSFSIQHSKIEIENLHSLDRYALSLRPNVTLSTILIENIHIVWSIITHATIWFVFTCKRFWYLEYLHLNMRQLLYIFFVTDLWIIHRPFHCAPFKKKTQSQICPRVIFQNIPCNNMFDRIL